MNVESIVQMPRAGLAMLFLDRWAVRTGQVGVSASELLSVLGRQDYPAEVIQSMLEALALGDESADAMASLLHASHTLERLEALSATLGLPKGLNPSVLEAAEALRQLLRGNGGQG